MDRTVKRSSRLSHSEWEALMARIQSHSQELESGLAKSNANLIEALAGLDGLEALTQSHLPQPAPLAPTPAAPTQSTFPTQVASTTNAPAEPTPVRYKTTREEYAPALNQNALVEALLQYQRQKTIRAPKAAPKIHGKSAASSQPKAEFAVMRFPSIEAEPKAAPLGRAAGPSVRLPVLRLKSEGTIGNPYSPINSDGSTDGEQE